MNEGKARASIKNTNSIMKTNQNLKTINE